MTSNIQIIEETILGVRETFAAALGVPDMAAASAVFQRESEFAIQILSRSEFAITTAMNNRQSVRDAIRNLAAIGTTLNPAKKLAYLVPRDKQICLDISYMGLIEIAIASGSIQWAKAEIVHQADTFKLNGFDKAPTHDHQPFDSAAKRGDIVGVYVVVKTRGGDYLTDTMSIDAVYDIRDRSSAWKAWVKSKKSCPWVTDEGEMIKKTVIKRAYKMWPRTDRLDNAVHYLNTDGGQGLDAGAGDSESGDAAVGPSFNVTDMINRIRAAQTPAEVSALRHEGLNAASSSRDRAAYDRITAAVARRREELAANVSDVQAREVNP